MACAVVWLPDNCLKISWQIVAKKDHEVIETIDHKVIPKIVSKIDLKIVQKIDLKFDLEIVHKLTKKLAKPFLKIDLNIFI